jgi:hypothetical protein
VRLSRRLETLEKSAGVDQLDRVRVWSDEVEANIDRIMARSDYKDFTIGLWGQVTDKDGCVVNGDAGCLS